MRDAIGGGGSLGWSLDGVYTSSALEKIIPSMGWLLQMHSVHPKKAPLVRGLVKLTDSMCHLL